MQDLIIEENEMVLAREFLRELLAKLDPHLDPDTRIILSRTKLVNNPRLRTAIGRAFYFENRIELNPHLLRIHPLELMPTLAHELAHIAAPLLFGRAGLGHQIGWKKVMEYLGFEPERTHTLSVEPLRRPHKPVTYATCGCPGFSHPVKPRMYRKITFGRARYQCIHCRQLLQLPT